MKIWLTKNTEVSIRDQLIEQISLGIASHDLERGERLPSVRELARRFQIHPNTVSAAYRKLAANGQVEFRKGSGVFVARIDSFHSAASSLDNLIIRFLTEARSQGFTPSDVLSRLAEHLEQDLRRRVVVVESDVSLREIIVEELTAGADCDVFGIEPEDLNEWSGKENVVIVAMFDEREKFARMPEQTESAIFLKTASVPNALNGRRRPAKDDIVGVVSGWSTFIALSRLFLIAAKIDPDSILTRHTDQPEWQRGLETASIVISDVVSAKKLQDRITPVIFRIISDESIEQIRHAVRARM